MISETVHWWTKQRSNTSMNRSMLYRMEDSEAQFGTACFVLQTSNQYTSNFLNMLSASFMTQEVTAIPGDSFASSFMMPGLEHLSVVGVQLYDLPCSHSAGYATLAALRSLRIILYSFDAPECRVLEPYVHVASDREAAARLPRLLAMTPNLIELTISFVRKQRVLREVSWDGPVLPRL